MAQPTDMLHTSALRRKLQVGEPCIGCWVGITDPFAVEALAEVSDLDWAIVDLEHGGLDWQGLQMIMLGWKVSETPLFVRVPSHDRTFLARVLDLGASGVLVPFVNTPEEAARIVAACNYPPVGTRGFGPRRASRNYTQTDEYYATANESVFVMVLIEHAEAVENVEAIARVPGVDALLIGPDDLSCSMGIPFQRENPKLLEAIRKVVNAGKDAGVPVAFAADLSSEDVARSFREGMQMATIGLDWRFMSEGIKQRAAEVRRLVEAG